MDDVLIFGRTQQEHDARLHAALQKIQNARVTLNKDKCEFSRNRLVFLASCGGAPPPNGNWTPTSGPCKPGKPTKKP